MEMSITRALAELKLLDSRIIRSIHEFDPVSTAIGKKPVTGYSSNQEYSDIVKSKFASIKDLIKRRNEIKTAIVKSNAENKVTVGEKKYTVAEAIERKNSIEYEKELLEKLRSSYAAANANYVMIENNVENRLDEHLKSIFGRDVKINKGDQEEESKVFLERNKPKFIDPLDVKKVIDELQKEIDDFLLNVDFVLSEANSLNKIKISD